MDNRIIVTESAQQEKPIVIGDSDSCDMTMREFLRVQSEIGFSIVKNEVFDNGKVILFWVKVHP